jgi:3-hydroxybutyrate dehydrogenase
MGERYLAGRAAWVTGGASGMGRAIALALADAGADVAIGSLIHHESVRTAPGLNLYTPTEAELASTRDEIATHGVRALALPLDVRSTESVRRFFDAATTSFGTVDVLVNAAGVSAHHLLVDHPDELWHDIVDINLNGPYRTSKICMPGMIGRRWGRIINIASTAASVGGPTFAAYCAAKSGLLGLTRCTALEGAPYGVTCNAVSPGSVPTPSNTVAVQNRLAREGGHRTVDEARAETAARIPLKRLVEAREVAAVAAFLCQEAAAAVTMENISVAGGALW